MNEEKFIKHIEKYPHPHKPFFARPHASRRQFFRLASAGLIGSFVSGNLRGQTIRSTQVPLLNKAKNVIFILLAGAPSHTDTFDLKIVKGTTPNQMAPETIKGLLWPTGVLPKLGTKIDDFVIARSVLPWALQHTLGQMWVQIGRSPAAVLGDVAPNFGSIVAAEKLSERKPSDVFPTFLALNSAGAVGSGFLPANYEPFRIAPSNAGLPNTSNADGQARFEAKYSMLQALDGDLRSSGKYGDGMADFDAFYKSARGLMYNATVDKAFKFAAADSTRYGNTSFGNACLVAKQVLEANAGTRYVQITVGGWDMHTDIYGAANPRGTNIFTLGKQLDDGVSEMLADLKTSGLLDETLVVMMGEFGRTTGPVTAAGGRDHYMQQFAFFAGAGVKGGRAIGSTDDTGGTTVDFGWKENRNIRPEDIEATIYSALGINYTNIRYDDPFGRGFEYVPSASEGLYRPINELWS